MKKNAKVAAKKNKKTAKAASGKNTRVEKLEVVVLELAIRVRDLESAITGLRATIAAAKPPAAPPWPMPNETPISPWNPIWSNVWTTVDYAKEIYNKYDNAKDKHKKHPGDQT